MTQTVLGPFCHHWLNKPRVAAVRNNIHLAFWAFWKTRWPCQLQQSFCPILDNTHRHSASYQEQQKDLVGNNQRNSTHTGLPESLWMATSPESKSLNPPSSFLPEWQAIFSFRSANLQSKWAVQQFNTGKVSTNLSWMVQIITWIVEPSASIDGSLLPSPATLSHLTALTGTFFKLKTTLKMKTSASGPYQTSNNTKDTEKWEWTLTVH